MVEMAINLETWLQSIRWNGRRLVLGDFNEEYHDSYISSVTAFFGLEFGGVDLATRWTGKMVHRLHAARSGQVLWWSAAAGLSVQ